MSETENYDRNTYRNVCAGVFRSPRIAIVYELNYNRNAMQLSLVRPGSAHPTYRFTFCGMSGWSGGAGAFRNVLGTFDDVTRESSSIPPNCYLLCCTNNEIGAMDPRPSHTAIVPSATCFLCPTSGCGVCARRANKTTILMNWYLRS